MQAIDEIRNAVEHALMNDEISIETYESLTAALSKGIGGFEVISVDVERTILILP